LEVDLTAKKDTANRLDSVRLLKEAAEAAHWELALIADVLKSAEDLLKQGQKIVQQHTPKERGVLLESLRTTKSRMEWSVIDCTKLRTIASDLKEQISRLNSLQPRSSPVSAEVQQIVTTSATITSLDCNDERPTPETLNRYPEMHGVFSMRDEQDRTEAEGRTWARYKSLQVLQSEYKVWYNRDAGISARTRTLGTYVSQAGGPKLNILIEWKYYIRSDHSSKDLALSRVERVAERLSGTGKPPAFRILDCVGWFVEESKQRCGIMFAVPPSICNRVGGRAGGVGCVTLGDLIRAKTRPSLEQRFRLAFLLTISLANLHMARWLHKNINAENIIFFIDREEGDSNWMNTIDITAPYVASFGLARPDQSFEQSEAAASSNAVLKAYQHPNYDTRIARQTQASDSTFQLSRYQQPYDIYSLGCVLLEVGLWKSLSALGWRDRYSRDLNQWQAILVQATLDNIPYSVGPVYKDIVLSCLSVRSVNESAHADMEEFCWNVVRKLDSLRV
jgi:hypothetical protein